jgi:hypothetical protein
MSVSVRSRFEVFKRDRFTCRYCGKHPPDVLLEVDHVIPRAAGGTDELDNLVAACWDCNRGKSDRLLHETSAPIISPSTVEEAQERAEQARAYAEAIQLDRELRLRFEDMVSDAWCRAFGGEATEIDGQPHWRLPEGRFPKQASVRRLLGLLPVMDMLDAVDITASRFRTPNEDAERYFFGICWSKTREREGR